ncbi:MAG: redox-regulated ATPase YchF [Nitrospirota bacterium]|nr:redox-regulated ATPase YchF [Nitrospirota bacterium]
MGVNCGIVGLPNVGKSTIFNAMTAAGAESANYPFCTIEPNIGIVPLSDPRLTRLAALFNSERTLPASVEFVDIAGLVAGASKGEGLGNQFLANIRETDAILHVVRCFEDSQVIHVEGSVNPQRDIATIDLELALADMESLEKRVSRLDRKVKSGDKEAARQLDVSQRVLNALNDGLPARSVSLSAEEREGLRDAHLITLKPVLFVANVAEQDIVTGNAHVDTVRKFAAEHGAEVVVISGVIESELAELAVEDRAAYLDDMGLTAPGLDRLAHAAYQLLGKITYFTAGPKESRAWTVRKGACAPEAAGEIHTDFERGFIRAEVVHYDDLNRVGSWQAAKEQGVLRLEGKDYVVRDGDVMHFRFNV